jgi:hypothetical protein
LVAYPGATQRLSSTHLSTEAGTIAIPAVTAPADLHLLATVAAVIQPMSLSVHRALPGSNRDWTTPCNARIKAVRMRTLEVALAC